MADSETNQNTPPTGAPSCQPYLFRVPCGFYASIEYRRALPFKSKVDDSWLSCAIILPDSHPACHMPASCVQRIYHTTFPVEYVGRMVHMGTEHFGVGFRLPVSEPRPKDQCEIMAQSLNKRPDARRIAREVAAFVETWTC